MQKSHFHAWIILPTWKDKTCLSRVKTCDICFLKCQFRICPPQLAIFIHMNQSLNMWKYSSATWEQDFFFLKWLFHIWMKAPVSNVNYTCLYISGFFHITVRDYIILQMFVTDLSLFFFPCLSSTGGTQNPERWYILTFIDAESHPALIFHLTPDVLTETAQPSGILFTQSPPSLMLFCPLIPQEILLYIWWKKGSKGMPWLSNAARLAAAEPLFRLLAASSSSSSSSGPGRLNLHHCVHLLSSWSYGNGSAGPLLWYLELKKTHTHTHMHTHRHTLRHTHSWPERQTNRRKSNKEWVLKCQRSSETVEEGRWGTSALLVLAGVLLLWWPPLHLSLLAIYQPNKGMFRMSENGARTHLHNEMCAM